MKELVEKIVRALVDSPEEVDVQVIRGTSMNLVKIRVPKKDIGAVLGKKGKNISALEAIVSGAGKGKERYIIEVLGGVKLKQRQVCKGKVKRLFEDRNYGFIEADDGRAVFFHGSSLKEMTLQSLSLGQPVEFEFEESPKGLRVVSTVRMTEGAS